MWARNPVFRAGNATRYVSWNPVLWSAARECAFSRCRRTDLKANIGYRTRRPGIYRCAYCKTNSRITAKDCNNHAPPPAGHTGSPLTEMPGWASGDGLLKDAARRIIQENYIADEPCPVCNELGVTCYRSRDPAKVKVCSSFLSYSLFYCVKSHTKYSLSVKKSCWFECSSAPTVGQVHTFRSRIVLEK